ncbi:Fis family transcriptional regulator [Stanieria sp. NIES-3757]|nr:Fis family transcriptional regulator [Stanieria sp. NIES-3757]
MIDPTTITITTTAIATVIFNKAIEKGGENLGGAVYDKIGQLLNFIRDKFQQEGREGKLLEAQEDPSEKNQDRFKQELAELMEDDEKFAKKLKILIDEIKSDQKANTIFFKDMNIKGSAKLGKIDLKSRGGNMEAVTDSKIGEDLTMGDVNMTNNG